MRVYEDTLEQFEGLQEDSSEEEKKIIEEKLNRILKEFNIIEHELRTKIEEIEDKGYNFFGE